MKLHLDMIDGIAFFVGYDVLIGDDVAVLIHDEACAGLLALARVLRDDKARGLVAEEPAEEFGGAVVIAGTALPFLIVGPAGRTPRRLRVVCCCSGCSRR